MCGRYVISSPPEAMRRAFHYIEQPNFPPRYNIAPTQPIPVVTLDGGARHFRLMRWGLIPSWVKDPRTFSLLINARAESVTAKPSFRAAMRRRRCLVPADGYYEWTATPGAKQPHFIHPRDGGPVGFAGLYETWIGPNGEELDTVAIITVPASPDLAGLHERMPAVILPEGFDFWLDAAKVDAETAAAMLAAPRRGFFSHHEVSRAVNRTANDSAALIAPVAAGEADA